MSKVQCSNQIMSIRCAVTIVIEVAGNIIYNDLAKRKISVGCKFGYVYIVASVYGAETFAVNFFSVVVYMESSLKAKWKGKEAGGR
jgi:hypothetical protein